MNAADRRMVWFSVVGAGIIVASVFVSSPLSSISVNAVGADNDGIHACFRPGPASCENAIITEIDKAAQTIDFEAYSLTNSAIVNALRRAASRGVTVRSVVDRTSLLSGSLPGQVWVDCRVSIQHNKVVLIDGATTITGSYNFTSAAEHHNAENSLIIRSKNVTRAFEDNFSALISDSVPGTNCKVADK